MAEEREDVTVVYEGSDPRDQIAVRFWGDADMTYAAEITVHEGDEKCAITLDYGKLKSVADFMSSIARTLAEEADSGKA